MQTDLKNANKREFLKAKRDKKLTELLAENQTEEENFYKNRSIKMTNMIGGIFKNAGSIGNPIQCMMVRNIRHFENVRKQTLAGVKEVQRQAQKEALNTSTARGQTKGRL